MQLLPANQNVWNPCRLIRPIIIILFFLLPDGHKEEQVLIYIHLLSDLAQFAQVSICFVSAATCTGRLRFCLYTYRRVVIFVGVCVCVCVYVFVYAYMCVFVYAYMCVHLHMSSGWRLLFLFLILILVHFVSRVC